MKYEITIFTPTYNRAYILPQLYKSLIEQSDKSFEWLIVDDGSEDNTTCIVAEWQRNKIITIRHIKTSNGGKQRAINRGAIEAEGELFFIVDSDDYLSSDAVATILSDWESIEKTKETVSGFCYKRVNYKTGKYIGNDFPEPPITTSLLKMVYFYKINGDMVQIFQTQMLRKFTFPEIEEEKFVPEGYIWYRITNEKPMIFINKGIYFCEYLPDGYTHNVKQNFRQNPKGFAIFYKDLIRYKEVSLKDKLKSLIRYFQMQYYILCNSCRKRN